MRSIGCRSTSRDATYSVGHRRVSLRSPGRSSRANLAALSSLLLIVSIPHPPISFRFYCITPGNNIICVCHCYNTHVRPLCRQLVQREKHVGVMPLISSLQLYFWLIMRAQWPRDAKSHHPSRNSMPHAAVLYCAYTCHCRSRRYIKRSCCDLIIYKDQKVQKQTLSLSFVVFLLDILPFFSSLLPTEKKIASA